MILIRENEEMNYVRVFNELLQQMDADRKKEWLKMYAEEQEINNLNSGYQELSTDEIIQVIEELGMHQHFSNEIVNHYMNVDERNEFLQFIEDNLDFFGDVSIEFELV